MRVVQHQVALFDAALPPLPAKGPRVLVAVEAADEARVAAMHGVDQLKEKQVATPAGLERAWTLDVEQVVRLLETDARAGLSTAQAAQRLAACGPNQLRLPAPTALWQRVLWQFHDPLIYLLLAAVGVSLLAWRIEGRHAWPVEALVIGLIVVINGVLSYLQQARARKVAAGLSARAAVTSAVLRDGRSIRVPVAELVPGDLLVLQAGDAVGADARLVEAQALRVQEARRTGEGQPVVKGVKTLADRPAPEDRVNLVFKDSMVVEGTAKAVVTATGRRNEVAGLAALADLAAVAGVAGLGRIDGSVQPWPRKPTPLQEEVLHLVRMLGIAVIGLATMVIVTVMLVSDIRDAGDVVTVLLLGVAFALAAVPQGLPALVATTLATGARRMARNQAVVKSLSSVETLVSCSVICIDTTGERVRSGPTFERRRDGAQEAGVPEEGADAAGAARAARPVQARDAMEARAAIREAHRAGVHTVMITGDDPATAARVAVDFGIIEPGTPILTGAQLDEMDEPALAVAVRATPVHASLSVRHKLRIIDALRLQGQVVVIAGAGPEDAPVLRRAHLGVATGLSATGLGATGAMRDAAGMIVEDGRFATLVGAMRESRGIFDNVRRFLRHLLSSHMGESMTVLLGVACAGFLGLAVQGQAVVLPLLATQVLWMNLVTGPAPAMAMAVESAALGVMTRGPHPATEPAIDARLWAEVIGIGGLMAVAALLTLDLYLPGGLIEGSQSPDNARTAGFTVLVLAQLFNSLTGRSGRSTSSGAFGRLFAGGWLWAAIVVAVLLQAAVVHVAFLNVAFGTVPLAPSQWMVCAATASLVLWPAGLRRLVRYASVNRREGRRE